MSPTVQLQKKLDAAGVRHFTASELLRIRHPAKARDVGITSKTFPASESIQDRLVEVALLADRLRCALGQPITVLNGYRPRSYNKAVGGSSGSQHIYGRGMDLTCERFHRPKLWELAREMHDAREIGGLGLYIGNIHIDTARHRIWGSQK